MKKVYTVVAMLLILVLVGCSNASVSSNSVPLLQDTNAASIGIDVPKVLEKALTMQTIQYEMIVKTSDKEQVWKGHQNNRDWTMTTTVNGDTLTLASDGDNLTGSFGNKALSIPPAMFGMFSPLEHLTFLKSQTATFKKLADDQQQRVALFRLPDKAVTEHITKLLGSQFQLANIIPEEINNLGVNYVLWYKADHELQKMGIVIYDKKDVKNEQRILYELEETK